MLTVIIIGLVGYMAATRKDVMVREPGRGPWPGLAGLPGPALQPIGP